jgi:hypothetical protein
MCGAQKKEGNAMTTEIQRFAILADRFEITISDNPDRDKATQWIDASLSLQYDSLQQVALVRLRALRDLQRIIDEETERCAHPLRSIAGALSIEDRILVNPLPAS